MTSVIVSSLEEDGYDLDSADEADLIALAAAPQGTKRKASFPELSSSKRTQTTFPCAVETLAKHFGFKSFQLKQEQVISRLLSGGSAAVVFPTGGGKSLCYQIPAIVFSELDRLAQTRNDNDHGVTLVVSPLIALMKDQVDALVRRGIKAAAMESTQSRDSYLRTCDMLRAGELKLLYCAPERLNNEGFVEQMKNVRGGIRLVAVDEAHCISEWGHAFRPDYLKIARFVKEIKAERVVCLTATATPRVARDICSAFNIDDAGLFRTSTYRPNLRLLAESAQTKMHMYPRLFQFLWRNPGPTIIYATLQKQTIALAEDLQDQGFNARAFHAGLDTALKMEIQDQFMARDDLIIVATIAFGMGIDKPNIRNVIHFNIPNSLESYSQEIGRAGRDGKVSNCMFYICSEDVHLREIFARGDLPARKSISGLFSDIFNEENANLLIGGEFTASHSEQQKKFDIRAVALTNIYAQLEMRHGLIRATTPKYTKHTFKPGPNYYSIISADESLPAKAIKVHSKPAKIWHHIDVGMASARSGVPRPDILRKLNDWNANGNIEVKFGGVMNTYKVIKQLPCTPAEIETLVQDVFSSMEAREEEAMARTDQMLRLVKTPACFARTLANHFGDDLPDGKYECGHCTWCLTHAPVIQFPKMPIEFNTDKFRAILSIVKDRDDPRFLARIAFGITSPRVSAMSAARRVLGSMADHEFLDLLAAFTAECREATQTSKP